MATFTLGHRGDNASGTIVLTGSGGVQPYEDRWALYKADLSPTGGITVYNKVASGNSFIGTADIYPNTTTDPTYSQWDRAFGILFYPSTGNVPQSQYAADHTWPSGQKTVLPGAGAVTHTVKLHSNGGSWYGGQTVLSYPVNDGDSFSFSGHDPTTPPSAVKRIAGWGVSAASTSIAYSTTATLTNVNRDYDFYALWASKIVVTFNADGGAFPGSQGGGSELREEFWQGGTIRFTNYRPTKDGYTLHGWKNGSVVYGRTDTFDISLAASSLTFVADWRVAILPFYWHGSDADDNDKFQTGELIAAAITAAAWNRLQDTVYALFSASGAEGSYTRQTAQPSGTIYAFQYNNTRAGLTAIKGAISGSTVRIPDEVYGENDTQHTPTTIIPSQWNGETTGFRPVASLKSALNHLIEDWS